MFRLENPIKEWWKCKKVFKVPKLRFSTYKDESDKWYYGWFSRRFFGIWSFGLDYKLKYDEPRFNDNPKIVVKIFNRILMIDFTAPDGISDMLYYEGVLWYAYKGKNIKRTFFNNIWHGRLDDAQPSRLTIVPFLRDKYKIECLEADVMNLYTCYAKAKEKLKSQSNNSEVSH